MAPDETPTLSAATNVAAFGLFDTMVPISSIVTVSVLVGYTLPRREYFGLFILLWWAVSVFISLSDCFVQRQQNQLQEPQESASSSQPAGGTIGAFILLGIPILVLCTLYIWFQQRRSRSSIREFVMKDVPIWSLVALHVYRLDGLSLITPFLNRTVPKFIGFQTMVLDVLMGATAVPLTWILYRRRKADVMDYKVALLPIPFKDVIWFWNSLGIYDLASAYLIVVMNFLGIGGELIVEPPLANVLLFHPLPLLILFQMTLAIAIHVLLLLHWDEMAEWQSSDLPLHARRLKKSLQR